MRRRSAGLEVCHANQTRKKKFKKASVSEPAEEAGSTTVHEKDENAEVKGCISTAAIVLYMAIASYVFLFKPTGDLRLFLEFVLKILDKLTD